MPRLRVAPGFTGSDEISDDVTLTLSDGGHKPMGTVGRGFSQPADFEYDRKKAIIEKQGREGQLAAKKRLSTGLPSRDETKLASAAQAETSDIKIPEMGAAAPAKGGDLKKGVYNNDDVRALQTSLKDIAVALGDKALDPGNVDADFGGNTERAVKAFQKRYGLTETGVVDAGTMREIQTIQSNLMRDNRSTRPPETVLNPPTDAPQLPTSSLAKMRTSGAPMTPAGERRLTTDAKARHAPNQYDMVEDLREAGVMSKEDRARRIERMKAEINQSDLRQLYEDLGFALNS